MCRVTSSLAWLCFVLACCATAGVARSGEQPSTSPIAEGVVRIVNSHGDEHSIGSGTLVARQQGFGVVLTCAHLFDDGVGELAVFFDAGTPRRAELIAKDDKNDLAVIAVNQPHGPVIAIARSAPDTGAELASCGFGEHGSFRANHGMCLGRVTLTDGKASGVIEIEGAARQGDSGGPIFNARHELVAVLFGSDGQVVDGTHCEVVRGFLKAQAVNAALKTRTALLARPVRETVQVFRPDYGGAPEAPAAPPEPVTIRGIVRYGEFTVTGARVELEGKASRTAGLDAEGRFTFEDVPSGHYELKIDAVVHNMHRKAERGVWIAPESADQEIVLSVK